MVYYEFLIEVSLDNTNECWLLKKVRANDDAFYLNCTIYVPWQTSFNCM